MSKKQQTLYRLKQDGEYKWYNTPDSFRSFDYFEEYIGEVKKGVPHGKGEIKSEKGHPQWTYTGEWQDGKEHGNGKIVYNDGRVYEGIWENGNYTIGKDKFDVELKNYTDNLYLKEKEEETEEEETEEEDDELEIYDSFEESYEGEHKDGLRHGKGILRYGNGIKYEGEFSNGLFHGEGKFEVYGHFDIDDLYGTDEELNEKFGFFYNPVVQIISFNGTWEKGIPLKGEGKIREYENIDNYSIHVYENIDIHSLGDDAYESYSTYIGDIENGQPHGFGELSN